MPETRMRTGVVIAFDDAAGVGTVRDDGDDGRGTEHFFHCTQIADGSRTIAVGTTVTYDIRPGHRGQWEATAITPAASPDRP